MPETEFEQADRLVPASRKDAILVVCPFSLDHVGHGNIQRCLALSRHLAAMGFSVDLVYPGDRAREPVPEQYACFRNVHRVIAPWRVFAETAWNTEIERWYGGYEMPHPDQRPLCALAGLTRALLESQPYSAVISTYAWTAPIFATAPRGVLRICDVQDVMHEFARAHERVTGEPSKFSLPAATEEFLWRQWDLLLAITPQDTAHICPQLLPGQQIVTVPHAAPSLARECSPGADDVAFYAGSDNDSNLRAVQWLLDDVWPLVRAARPAATLKLAGLICRALPDRVKQIPGVDLLGFRTDLTTDLASSGVVVAPYLFGSGLKIKVVEAACAGKAIVTTSDGAIGSGLTAGHALAVHRDPAAFAAALIDLLGSADRRRTMGRHALAEAHALFSPSACYDVVGHAIRMTTVPDTTVAEGAIEAMRLHRIKAIWARLAPKRVVIWGNGAHTRTLIRGLEALSIPVALIVDKRAAAPSVSPEGLPVLPAATSGVHAGHDLILLSSETFEAEMWRDLTAWRRGGHWVIGLYEGRRISRAVWQRLTAGTRELLAPPLPDPPADLRGARPRVIFWDSSPIEERWSTLSWIEELAAAAERRGRETVLLTSPLSTPSGLDAWVAPDAVGIAQLLDPHVRRQFAHGLEEGLSDLMRLSELASRSATRAFERLVLDARDVIVMLSPTLVECLALPRALRTMPCGARPSIVLHGMRSAAADREWSGLTDGEVHAFYRMALSDLRDAADGRVGVTAADECEASAAIAWSVMSARAVGYPPSTASSSRKRASETIQDRFVLCFGRIADVHVRGLLDAVLAEGDACDGSWRVLWRSAQGDGPADDDLSWARDFARWRAGRVELIDGATSATVRDAIESASAVVLLGEWNAADWPTAVCAHAARVGVPVIAPAEGMAARHILNGCVRGFVYPVGNAPALVEGLRAVMTATEAPPPRSTLIAAADDVFDGLVRASEGVAARPEASVSL